MRRDSKDLKDMASLLRQGATMTDLSCPECSSPLFRMPSGELWCAKCKKRVVVVREGEPAEAFTPIVLSNLESTLLMKVEEINALMSGESDPEEVKRLGEVLLNLLENLSRVRRMIRG